MNENQHSITVLFNPVPDPQEKKGRPQPTPFCVTACFSNLPAGTDVVKLTKRFYENLMRSLDSAIAECKTGKRDGVVPMQIVTIATALVTAEFGGEDVPADGTNPIDSSTPTDDADPAAHGEGDDANIGDNDKPAGEAGSEGDSNAATGEAGGDAGANVGASEGNDTGSGGNDVESAVEPSMEASDANESGGAV